METPGIISATIRPVPVRIAGARTAEKPEIRKVKPRTGAAWTFRASHPDVGACYLFGRSDADLFQWTAGSMAT
jgi:hypothetical protein